MKKRIVGLLLLLLILVVSACSNNSDEAVKENQDDTDVVEDIEISFEEIDMTDLDGDKVIAIFQGGEVKGNEFREYLAVQMFLNPYMPVNDPEFRVQVMNDFIIEKMLSAKVTDEAWAKEQVDAVWGKITESYDKATIDKAYKTLQINEEKVKKALTSIVKVQKYFQDQVTEADLQAYYDEIKAQITKAAFSHVLIGFNEDESLGLELRTEEEALKLANEVYEKIVNGADLKEMVKEYSDDVASVESGGYYDNVDIYNLVPEFGAALLELEKDEISKPVRTEYGYHIIKLERLLTTPFEQISKSLVGEVTHRKYLDYYYDEHPKYVVEINLSK